MSQSLDKYNPPRMNHGEIENENATIVKNPAICKIMDELRGYCPR
jgi:hypothetical protein